MMPNGTLMALSEVKGRRPLLLLNPDELTEEGFSHIAHSDLNRSLFSSAKAFRLLVDQAAKTMPQADIPAVLEHILGGPANEAAGNQMHSISSLLQVQTSDSELEHELGALYDLALSGLEADVPESVKHARRIAAISRTSHIFHHFYLNAEPPADIPLLAYDASLEAPFMAAREQAVQHILDDLPADIRQALDDIGVEILVGDDARYIGGETNHIGSSDYEEGKIRLTYFAHKYHVAEEIVHQLDAHYGFSQNPQWQQAAQDDMASSSTARQLLREGIEPVKQPIEQYPPAERATEMLAELMVLDMYGLHPEGQSLEEAFPNCWPMYQDFRKTLSEPQLTAERFEHRGIAVDKTAIDQTQSCGRTSY